MSAKQVMFLRGKDYLSSGCLYPAYKSFFGLSNFQLIWEKIQLDKIVLSHVCSSLVLIVKI